jgi:hypothetical protein
MPCVDPAPGHLDVLTLLARGEPVPEDLAAVDEELRRWGWVMSSFDELTGIGWAHAGVAGRGLLGT